MSLRFKELFQHLKSEAKEPWEFAYELQEYVAEALAWVFADRIQQTGYFQHSLTPDFYINFESGPRLAIHLRFNPLSVHSLFGNLTSAHKRSVHGLKHVILIPEALSDSLLQSVPKNVISNKRFLVTTFRLVDEIHRVMDVVEEQGLDRVLRRLRTAMHKVQEWVLDAYGWQPSVAAEDFLGPVLHREPTSHKFLTQGRFTTFVTPQEVGKDVADYVASGTSLSLRRHTGKSLPSDSSADNLRLVHQINRYGRATAIVSAKEQGLWRPLATVVFSTHAPMGQNPFQLFPQAVASVSEGVPFLLVTPDRLGVFRDDGHWTTEEMSPLFYQALGRLMDIYNVPALALPWPIIEDRNGYHRLRHDHRFPSLPPRADGSIQLLFRVIDLAIKAYLDGFNVPEMVMGYHGLTRRRLEMEEPLCAKIEGDSRPSKLGL